MNNFRIDAITKANIKIKANLFLLWKIREKACLKKAKKVFLGYRYWTQSIIIILLCRILIHPEVVTVDLYHGSLKWVQLLGLDLMRLNVANITSTRLSQSEQFRLQFSFLGDLWFLHYSFCSFCEVLHWQLNYQQGHSCKIGNASDLRG